MSAPSVIDDAIAIINADPILRAVASFSMGACMVVDGEAEVTQVRADAALIVASRTPLDESTPDDTHTYTITEAHRLAVQVERQRSDIGNALHRLHLALHDVERDMDADGRAAAMGSVNEACRALATLRRVWGERG